jgi:hypothetical protein
VVLDVEHGHLQDRRIVLELPEPAVAVEAQEGSHGTGRMIMINMDCRRRSADGTESLLSGEHVVGLSGCDPVPPLQVISA